MRKGAFLPDFSALRGTSIKADYTSGNKPFAPFSECIAMDAKTSSTPSSTPSDALPIPQEAFDWYDEYAHGVIDRRTFMTRLGTLAAAGFAMSTLLSELMPSYAEAEQVSFNDPDIKATYETFASPKGYGEGRGYLVVPAKLEAPTAAVLVIHENRGLNPYVRDVARRVAKAGYVAFAPDALHSLGGYPGNDDEGRAMQKSLDRSKIEQDFIAAAGHLKSHEHANGKLGAVGFCFGGYIVNLLAAVMPDELERGRAFLRHAGGAGTAKEREGPAADSAGRAGQAGERQLAGLRGGFEGERGRVHPAPVRGRSARVSQRLDGAVRPGDGGAGLGAHAGVLCRAPWRVTWRLFDNEF